MARKPKLYEKPWQRGTGDTIRERDLGYGRLLDFKNSKDVQLFWDFHPEATKDRIVKLKVGKEEVWLDVEQMMKFLRWV